MTSEHASAVTEVFPPSERVVYARQSLEQVIAQLRFPPVLRVDAEPPADFQERIRHLYPIFRDETVVEAPLPLPPEVARHLPPEIAKQFAGQLRITAGTGNKTYRFASDDDKWLVSLTRDAVSLTADGYERWEEFRDRLASITAALEELYRPAFYSRIGLRYRNVICRSELGLDGVPWSELLAGPIAADLSYDPIATSADISAHQVHFIVSPDIEVLLQHGFGTKAGESESCYLVDADFYRAERIEVPDAPALLERLHDQAGRLFRWAISDRLHVALEPEPI